MKPASKLKRFIAILIDSIIAAVLGFAPIVGMFLPFLYLLFRDGMCIKGFKNRSIGKLAMGLKVVNLEATHEKQTPIDSVKRNILMIIPFMGLIEGIVVLVDDKGLRLGDRIAQTLVVEDSPVS